MSDPLPVVEAKSVVPEWLDWILILVFFVGPTIWNWIRRASQGAGQENPKPKPTKPARPAQPKPTAARSGQSERQRRGANQPAGRATASSRNRAEGVRRGEELLEKLGARKAPGRASSSEASSVEAVHEQVWEESSPQSRAALTVDEMSQAPALSTLLAPLARQGAIGGVLQQAEVQRAIHERLAFSAAPWRLTGAMQVAGVAVQSRIPGLRQEVYAAAGLPQEGIQITSLQELVEVPELLVASWIEVLFSDVLGLWTAGPVYARARVVSLIQSGAVSEMNWNVRSGGMVLNPPARLVAPVLSGVLRHYGAIREAQDLSALVDEEAEGSLKLNIQGLGRTVALTLPEEILVSESLSAIRSLAEFNYSSLGKWAPASEFAQRWAEVMPGVRRFGENLKFGRVQRAMTLDTVLGLLWECSVQGTAQVDALLAKAQVESGPKRGRQRETSSGYPGGILEPLTRQSLVESLVVGTLISPPGGRSGRTPKTGLL